MYSVESFVWGTRAIKRDNPADEGQDELMVASQGQFGRAIQSMDPDPCGVRFTDELVQLGFEFQSAFRRTAMVNSPVWRLEKEICYMRFAERSQSGLFAHGVLKEPGGLP